MKFVVKSNKPVDKNNLEIEAIDESAAIAEFVKKNGLTTKSSAHKFSVSVVGEDNREKVEFEVVKDEPDMVVETPAPKPKRGRPAKKKDE